jgi:succinyl-diaminopimelate desuccinylase
VKELVWRPPAKVSTENPYLVLLRESIDGVVDTPSRGVGRDGTNDGIHFLKVGIPSVEFGPVGGGHHGPEEHVSVASLRQYRVALLEFLQAVARDREALEGVTVRTPSGTSRRGEEPRSLL